MTRQAEQQLNPSPWELGVTLAIVMLTVFALFAFAKVENSNKFNRDGGYAQKAPAESPTQGKKS